MRGLVIVARQRTGTHLLRGSLSHSTDACDVSEVFHPEIKNIKGNFFTWYFEHHESIPASRPFDWCLKLFEDYIDFLERECPIPMIDFKYNCFNSFVQTWASPATLPLFLQRLMNRNYKVVHLVRRSRLETIVSQLIADKTGRFVVETDDLSASGAPVEINIQEFTYLLKLYGRELDFIRPWLAEYRNSIEIVYEELVSSIQSGTMEEFIKLVIDGTDVKYFTYKPASYRKAIPDWRTAVSNAEEVEKAARLFGAA